MKRIRAPRGYRMKIIPLILLVVGCTSPEDGRPRGGGAGGDGGNYRKLPIHAPSKIDGTKSVPANTP